MGKVDFTDEQKVIVQALTSEEELVNKFYFTGGTALNIYYLQHRLSEDLDFFSETQFDNNVILTFMNKVSAKLKSQVRFTQIHQTRIFELMKKGKLLVKVDFNYYPFKRIQPGKIIQRLMIDSLVDIAINKLMTINQRTEVKDFVDLYYLSQDFTIWDLMEGVRKKFRVELDPVLVAADMLKVESFTTMPKMIKPLTLKELKDFFKREAKQMGIEFTY